MKTLSMSVVSVFFISVFATVAHADVATCGAIRKIERSVSASCAGAPAGELDVLEAQAEAAVRDRLAKFDSECAAIKGSIEELNLTKNPHSNVQPPSVDCTSGPNGVPHCIHSPGSCEWVGDVTITQACNCQ